MDSEVIFWLLIWFTHATPVGQDTLWHINSSISGRFPTLVPRWRKPGWGSPNFWSCEINITPCTSASKNLFREMRMMNNFQCQNIHPLLNDLTRETWPIDWIWWYCPGDVGLQAFTTKLYFSWWIFNYL